MCVGIDEYQSAPLAGCVADATDWRDTLTSLGFETTLLTNKQATREAILAGLADLVEQLTAGRHRRVPVRRPRHAVRRSR